MTSWIALWQVGFHYDKLVGTMTSWTVPWQVWLYHDKLDCTMTSWTTILHHDKLDLTIRVIESMLKFEFGLPRGRNVTNSITDDNPKIWRWSNEVCAWPPPPPLILEGGSACSNYVKTTFFLNLISPQRIEQLSSTWAHFKEQTQLFKMSPNWAQLLNSFRSESLPKLMLFS